MIFLVKEQGFCGSVTVHVEAYGIEAPDFAAAKDLLTKIVISGGGKIRDDEYYKEKQDTEIHYEYPNVQGWMEDKPISMLTEANIHNPPIVLDQSDFLVPANEKTSFDVILEYIGSNKLQVLRVLRQSVLNLGCKDALNICRNLPSVILEGVSQEKAVEVKGKLEYFGAKVKIV